MGALLRSSLRTDLLGFREQFSKMTGMKAGLQRVGMGVLDKKGVRGRGSGGSKNGAVYLLFFKILVVKYT